MLEPILKGLVEWIYGLMVDIMSYASGELLGVMSMDLSYFKTTAPIITDIVNVFVALGWALLIGNLVFQALKSMMSGAGFEAEDPKMLFLRTFVFSFLLLASQQICEIGLSITGKVIDLLNLPDSIEVKIPDESMFSLGGEAKWLLVIIVGVVLMIQMVKLLFEIGERYVITSVLTFFSPLAFSMGGSKNTSDIFKGWVRMYCSMLLMMIMNIVFLKLIMSAMSQLTSGGVLIWLVFVVALTRVARKIDSHIGKIGLTPAQTGNPIGGSLPGMMTMMAVRVMSSTISRSLAGGKGEKGRSGASGGRRAHSGRGARPYSSSYSSGSATENHGGSSLSKQSGEFNSSLSGYTGSHSAAYQGSSSNETMNTAEYKGKSAAPGPSGGKTPSVHSAGNMQSVRMPARDGVNPPTGSTGGLGGAGGSKSIHSTESETAFGKGGKTSPTPRPPLPRDTKSPSGETVPTYSTVKSETIRKNNSDSVKNTEREIHKGAAPGSKGIEPRISPTGQKTNITENKAGINHNSGEFHSGSEIQYSHSDGGGSVSKEGAKFTTVAPGSVQTTSRIPGDTGRTHNSGEKNGVNIEAHSDIHGDSHFADKSTQYEHEIQNRGFTQTGSRIQTSEKPGNHEFKYGRFNPAAANKKTGRTYYQKDISPLGHEAEKDRRRKRREENGKHKR